MRVLIILILSLSACKHSKDYLTQTVTINDSLSLSYFIEQQSILSELKFNKRKSSISQVYSFYGNGSILCVQKLYNDSMVDRSDYYRNGILKSRYIGVNFYVIPNKIHGFSAEFYENGRPKDSTYWRHGLPYGTHKHFDESGVLIKTLIYNEQGECIERKGDLH